MKKTLAVIVLAMVAALALCLVGCNSGSSSASSDSESQGKTYVRHETTRSENLEYRETVSEQELLDKVDSVLLAQFNKGGAFENYNPDKSRYEVATIKEDCLRRYCPPNNSVLGDEIVDGKQVYDAIEVYGNIDLYDDYGKLADNATFMIQLNPWDRAPGYDFKAKLCYGQYEVKGKTIINGIYE